MKIHTIHNGCEANLADSEQSKIDLIAKNGFELSNKADSDYIIFHSCTFTKLKEEETINTIESLLKSTDKKIIVSGCFLNEYIKNDRIQYVKNEKLPGLDWVGISKKQSHKVIEKKAKTLLPFITISRGCYGNCSFCSIKLAQGNNKSKDLESILKDVELRKDLDYIKLVGDEVAGYGLDKNLSLKILLEIIIEKFPTLKIKLGSLNCKLLKRYSIDELKIFAHPNIIGNIHMPIQSASNRILKLMNRGYTIEEYLEVFNKLKSIGVVKVSGDLICGFPKETEIDHEKNIRFISDNNFEFLEVFAYTEREGTKASTYTQLPNQIREERTIQIIVNFMKSYCNWHNISINDLVKNKQYKIFNTNIKID